jgi:hypothetical protein
VWFYCVAVMLALAYVLWWDLQLHYITSYNYKLQIINYKLQSLKKEEPRL